MNLLSGVNNTNNEEETKDVKAYLEDADLHFNIY